jgi:hypothetical protein
MLLIDSAEFQAKEMARLCNIPSIPCRRIAVGGYSYVSNEGAHGLVVIWCETIRGMHRVNTLTKQRLPNGTYVEFDVEDYLTAEYSLPNQDMHKCLRPLM